MKTAIYRYRRLRRTMSEWPLVALHELLSHHHKRDTFKVELRKWSVSMGHIFETNLVHLAICNRMQYRQFLTFSKLF